MQTLLGQLNAVPGVVGSLVSGADGRLLAHAFPPAFDLATLAAAAKTASESSAGLATVTGTMDMLDLRCANARILVRPVSGASLLFLCAPSMNLQPLAISASVVAPKIEKLLAGSSAPAPGPAATAAGRPPGQLHAAVQRINAAIERRKLDPFKVRGEIAMKAGFGLGFIDADTPDDAAKLSKLKAAATAVLGEPV